MVILLGFAAGLITTVAGMGGGILLVLLLGMWWGDPGQALAVTAPAMLVGNLHRYVIYRRALRWRVALPYICGALPGAVLGGLFAVSVPSGVLHAVMCVAAVGAVAHAVWKRPFALGILGLVPAGMGVGMLTATAGGGGYVTGPLLLSMGLSGPAYLATAALSSVSMHTGRLIAYGVGGWLDGSVLLFAAGLALTISLGNQAGAVVRLHLSGETVSRLELGAAVLLVLLAVIGVVG